MHVRPPPILTLKQTRDIIIAAVLTIFFCGMLLVFAEYVPYAATGCTRIANAMPLFGDCNFFLP